MLEITLPEENPRLNELQRSLLSAQHGPGTVPNESVLSGHSARNRAQVVHPGGSVVAGSIGRGSIGRLSRFSTTAGDTLSRKAHVISLIANTALLLGKSYVYWKSQSMAVLASLIDSAVDMVAQGVLMVANRIVTDRRDEQNVRYPAGRSKLESIGVVACAFVMVMAAAQVIQSAVNELLGAPRLLDVGLLNMCIMASTTVVKLGLWAWCKEVFRKTHNVTVEAVAQDNLNDVLTNAVALGSALAAASIAPLWVVDPIGAILLSLFIIGSWVSTAIEQVEMIIGRSADAEFLDVVREMAETHDPGALLDCMRAYHFGPKFLVEVEIVMAEDTLLRDSHDCGIMLQHKIESLPEVERCFVHIDYQQREVDDHDPKARCAPPLIACESACCAYAAMRTRTCTCTCTRTCTCTCTCTCAQVPVEYKTQLSSSMPPLTPKTPEGAAPKHAGGDGTGLYSTEGLYSTTAAAAAARLETQISGGGLPPPAVAQGDPPAVAQDDTSGV